MKKILLMCLVALLGIGAVNAQKPKKGEKKSVTVEFMTSLDCEGCAKKINETLPYEKGVRDVKVDVPTKVVTVTYDPTKTNNEAIIKAFAKVKIEASVKEGCTDGCCGHNHEAEKKECADDCCGEHKHKAEKQECKDECCSGHDHGHDHDHGHNHAHKH